jgi:thiol-disulfide isomerase/thioredoxin
LALACAAICLGPSHSAAGELSAVKTESRPELRLTDLDGQQWDLGKLRGQVVVVNFWASWCTPCLEEMPSIQRLAEAMRGKPFAVISVNVAEGQGRAQMAARQMGITFPVLLDEDSAVFNRWGATVLPTTFLLDRDGVVRYLGRGPLEWDGAEAVALIERLLPRATVDDPQP